ncbi:Bug family tripartite tricarboxylate transporter substrate binding protein [Achromobacter ruhlandii]|uniref:Bug family tripartite tricarboxylate transporter substrate binding protein n=1 Tax=Achromobacter ruhlandii TaxID=72557 RepID=UPI0006C3959B|nr:tripartite tricarboxylate transporter substrate binding protein [Achromobacter ruhlandii]AMG46460.1 tripartite tricarboxylate transporter substrate binding protein [Achromobacter xylosoxidans]CUI67505.1 Argininosuccinate lyase [Achromobacter ruhlandii]CUJ05719.1 Argininosuccinate lyase [Achromobacter ruhlandii]CUK15417.1 Argininosuccinate lyase [Achromobacter ruhlandii]
MTPLAKAGAALALMAATTLAHAWPDKPVKIVVPYPPGGNVDVAARLIGPGLQAAFGQPFIVENKPGAGGMIAGEQVARAAPDGYTLFMAANGPLLFSPLIFKRQAYKWDKDFEPISSVSYTPLVLQVRPGLPAKDLGELLALARKEPGKLNMASPGAGTTNHLVSELLQSLTGARWTTAQYKGNAPATTDLLGGQVDFNFDQISVSLPYIKEGRTRGLAVTTARRVPSLPDVPTFAEAGVPGMEAATFTGLLAPKGTPPEVLARLSQALEKILSQPDIIQRFQELGADAQASSPADFTRYLAAEDARWTPIIERAGITAN